jgi:ABC-type molybdate transport system substrate-binding protein
MISNRRCSVRWLLGAVLLAAMAAGGAQAANLGWQGQVQPPSYRGEIFPPWQGGANNPALNKGLEFTVPEINDLPDFHGNLHDPKLVIFVGGNYFFAMAPLVHAFEALHPHLRGAIFYETLPPGILEKQMQYGGTITVGNMTWTVKPDIYAAGKLKVAGLIKSGMLAGPQVDYVTNDLVIMIPRDNPAKISSLKDLGRPSVRVAMPNPAWEGVARQIKLSLTKAGGPALEKMVYKTKVKDGSTLLTHIHHRQTPLYLMQGLVQAGVTWKSEAVFQEQVGHPIGYLLIPADENTTAVYSAAMVKGSAHPRAAQQWLEFLRSATALRIFEHYGFKPVTGAEKP